MSRSHDSSVPVRDRVRVKRKRWWTVAFMNSWPAGAASSTTPHSSQKELVLRWMRGWGMMMLQSRRKNSQVQSTNSMKRGMILSARPRGGCSASAARSACPWPCSTGLPAPAAR